MVSFDRDAIDYSLYLVTGRELLPEGKVSASPSSAPFQTQGLMALPAGLL